MSSRAHGQIRRGQVITTWGPGSLIDMPNHAAVMGGLETWPSLDHLKEIVEPRLSRKLEAMTNLPFPRLYAPPAAEGRKPWETQLGIGAWRFPEWFLVQEDPYKGSGSGPDKRGRRGGSRRLVHRKALDERGRFDGRPVVPAVHVRACPRGHLDDLDWSAFVHAADTAGPHGTPSTQAGSGVGGSYCGRALWLDQTGTAGDLGELVVRCECGKRRRLYEAADVSLKTLGQCTGARPWLGRNANESCGHPARLLVRTASNAYFPQIVAVLSLPDPGSEIRRAVESLWNDLTIVDDAAGLAFMKRKPDVAAALAPFDDERVLEAIAEKKGGRGGDQPVKRVELDAVLNVPEGYGDDVPIDPKFHARRLPDSAWRRDGRLRPPLDEAQRDSQGGGPHAGASADALAPVAVPPFSSPGAGSRAGTSASSRIASVVQLHRLREVMALVGFTRLEATTPDIHGEYDSDVEPAALARVPEWFPAVENRGEGVFVQLDTGAVCEWLERDAVQDRLAALERGHEAWCEDRNATRAFPGGPYILLHTLSHLLIQSLAMRCGYPATSIRERVYVEGDRYGILLYTGSPDADGTLGGLVQQARRIEDHLDHACGAAVLCSNDPICAQHAPETALEGHLLLGAACHACALVAETSCEMRNDYLDRALVVPVIGHEGAAFFPAPSW